MPTVRQLLTVGVIAKQLKVPLHRVIYAQRSRGITPHGRIGNTFFFDNKQLSDFQKAVASLRPLRRRKVRSGAVRSGQMRTGADKV